MSKLGNLRNFIIGIIITVFLMILGVLFVLLSNMLRDKQTDILMLKKQIAVTEINYQFEEIESLLKTVSFTVESGASDELLYHLMHETVDQNDLILQVYFGRPDKSYIITAENNLPDDFDITQRPWYQTALSYGDISFTDVYIDAIEFTPIISVVIPIYNQGSILGVLGADIALAPMTAFINDIIDEDIGFAFVLDEKGDILAHSLISENFNSLVNYQRYDIPFSDLQEKSGITDSINVQGEKGKIAYERIDNSDFIFGIFMTDKEITQNAFLVFVMGITMIALVLVVIFVALIAYSKFVNKPLRSLINDIEMIDISNHPEYRLIADGKSKFREARLALNALIDVSVSYHSQLKKSLEELAFENQKFKFLLSSSPDLVFVIDKNLVYQEVYGDTQRPLEISSHSMIGKTHYEVFGKDKYPEREEQYKRVLKGETVLYSWESHIKGNAYFYETMISPIFNKNKEITGIVGVSRDITEQENRYKEMLYISTHDYLTGLYNRKTYDEKLNQLKETQSFPFALINMDLNGLKLINDAYGHHNGDLAIKKTAEILKASANETDVVSRVGGDEFTVIIHHATNKDVREFMKRLKKNFKTQKINHMDLSIAVGYYILKDDTISIDELKKLAENDMYKEKILEKKKYTKNAINAIMKSLMDKSVYHKNQIEQVLAYARLMGSTLDLTDSEKQVLENASYFYCIGKIAIPNEIILKKGPLTDDEFDIVKSHTVVGYDLLKSADDYSSIAIYASTYHEHYDGGGYPKGLSGEDIPYFSRVISVIDAYVAMINDRPYRNRMTVEQAKKELLEHMGTQFDPDIVRIFIEKVIV